MKTPRYTIDNLHELFPDDNACLDYIFQQRFGGMVENKKGEGKITAITVALPFIWAMATQVTEIQTDESLTITG